MSFTIGVGLLGCGNIGTAFATTLQKRSSEIERETGLRLELRRIAVNSLSKSRPESLEPSLFTDDGMSVAQDGDIDVIVEVIGGTGRPGDFVRAALEAGKSVVTGNKELIAAFGDELFAVAERARVDLLFETAVVAAVPILRPLRESLLVEPVSMVAGIINGTSNFILSAMSDSGARFEDALREAQLNGFAEPDATADVSGADAASKLAILASLAFNTWVAAKDVERQGIADLTLEDFALARRMGYVIKLLGMAERSANGFGVGLRVSPTLVAETHPLASVSGTFNAVVVVGEWSGELMFYGRGAGRGPSVSSLLGDVVDAADNRRRGTFRPVPACANTIDLGHASLEREFMISLTLRDEPGVLSEVTAVFGTNKVSIERMVQLSRGEEAVVVFVTHLVPEESVERSIAGLKELSCVASIDRVMRVFSGAR